MGAVFAAVFLLSAMAAGAAFGNSRGGKGRAQKSAVVMSYNIRHGEGIDGKTDYSRIVRVITVCNADVVAVQEVDSVTLRSNGNDVLAAIAAEAGMHHVFARAITFEGGSYGIGILSKEKPLSVKRVPLPGREESRMLLVVEFADYYMGCMHLSLTPADQMASLPIINKVASQLRKPFFLAGDWNVSPSDPFISAIGKNATLFNDTTQCTFPADRPDVLLDYISAWKSTVAGRKCGSRWFKVLPEAVASDHRAVAAEIVWR